MERDLAIFVDKKIKKIGAGRDCEMKVRTLRIYVSSPIRSVCTLHSLLCTLQSVRRSPGARSQDSPSGRTCTVLANGQTTTNGARSITREGSSGSDTPITISKYRKRVEFCCNYPHCGDSTKFPLEYCTGSLSNL